MKPVREFQEISEKLSYIDLLNIRFRVGRKAWEMPIKNYRRQFFFEVNKNPKQRNILYIHIPFCASRCSYCPYFAEIYSKNLVKEYIKAVENEIELIKNTPYIQSTSFQGVFFGGGTPSVLRPDELEQLMSMVQNNFKLEENTEITLESNPSSLTGEKIKKMKEVGINRVSLGIQTFNNKMLRDMHCAHTREKALEILDILLEYGFLVNIDLIFGLIGQTTEEMLIDLEELARIEKPHQTTIYPLKVIPDTPLFLENNIDAAEYEKHLRNLDKIVNDKMTGNNYRREKFPIFYNKEGAPDHHYHSTDCRVVGVGASAGTILEGVECINTVDVKKYIKEMKEGVESINTEVKLTPQQVLERHIVYLIIFLNRSLDNFKEVVSEEFEHYFGREIGDLYDTVVHDMVKGRYISVNNGKIKIERRLSKLFQNLSIGNPSII